MRAKILLIMFTLLTGCVISGCTTYSIKRDAQGIISVDVRSTRSFEAPDLKYHRFGDEEVSFDFKAAGVDNNTDLLIGMFSSMIGMMQGIMINQPATDGK